MQRILIAVAVIGFTSSSALAQNDVATGECEGRFKAADSNEDGILTVTEIPKAQNLPSSLAKEVLISRKEYITACVKAIAAAGPQASGETVAPEKGALQPQGPTGPLETKSGGAPASSPQGQTPPGMQAAPEGSSKVIVDPAAKK